MKETERSRITPKILFYCCFIFYLCWVSIILAQEQKLSPIILWEKLRLQVLSPIHNCGTQNPVTMEAYFCYFKSIMHNTPGKTNRLSSLFFFKVHYF